MEKVSRLFLPSIHYPLPSLLYRFKHSHSNPRPSHPQHPHETAAEKQIKAMNEDMCLLVDTHDHHFGYASKKECHYRTFPDWNQNQNEKGKKGSEENSESSGPDAEFQSVSALPTFSFVQHQETHEHHTPTHGKHHHAHHQPNLHHKKDQNVPPSLEQAHVPERLVVRSGLLLHRAFSVFIFRDGEEGGKKSESPKSQLLLQKRAKSKLTFPSCISNACCSHPTQHIKDHHRHWLGVQRAALERLEFELGIHNLDYSDLIPMTKILYFAVSPQDPRWGEYELDYLLLLRKNVKVNMNPDEVEETYWMDYDETKELMKQDREREIKEQGLERERARLLAQGYSPSTQEQQKEQETEREDRKELTPWFRMFGERMLFDWWRDMDSDSFLKTHSQPNHIHHFHDFHSPQHHHHHHHTHHHHH